MTTHRNISAIALLLLITVNLSFAQGNKKTGIVKGKLINSTTKAPFSNLKVTIPVLNVFTNADGEGNFTISEVPYGNHMLVISGLNATRDTLRITTDKKITDVNEISIRPSDRIITIENIEIPTINVADNGSDANTDNDGGTSTQNTGGLFVATQDPFLYNLFSFYYNFRFRPRGFYGTETQINGIPLIDFERGYSTWGQLGGLNDVLHGRHTTYGLQPSEYAYGDLNGTTYIDASAADQRKGTNVSYTNSNRTFRNRIMVTHSTGLMKNGWAASFSASRRWGNEGFVKGTFYDGYSFYAAVSKIINKSQFNLTAIGAPTKYGKAAYAATDEVYSIANDKQYNPYWGYQNGKVRNSRVVEAFQPMIIANHTYTPSDRIRWNTAIGYDFGKYKSSTIDYYNASSPYPDYYRNLPSYYLTFSPPNTGIANAVRTQLMAHPEQMQVNWDALYNANYSNTETLHDVNGIVGNNYTGKRSLYVLSNYVDNVKKTSFNSNIEYNKNEHLTIYGGIKVISQVDEFYKQLTDLLGGDYYLNNNQFASQQVVANPAITQNNLNKPNQLIKVGDKYGYDYKENMKIGNGWGQAVLLYNKVDFFAAADLGYSSFFREGFMKNGLFPDNSYGKSPAQSFFTYKVKGGITYKLDRRNFLYLNAEFRQEAPLVANTYISVATRDYTVDKPVVYKVKTLEGGYVMKSPIFNVRATGYVTDQNDLTEILRFYNDDPDILSFVNYVMKGVSKRSIGTELMGSLKVNKEFTLTGIASIGQTFYTSSPTVTVYQDNDPTLASTAHKVFIKNYYVGNGPQSVYGLGINYRPRNYWHANLNLNYIDNSYVSINPDRRTTIAADTIKKGSPQWVNIYSQEKLPGAFSVDISGGKSFSLGKYLKKYHQTLLNLNIGVNNLLNNTNIKVSGYEQLRYDYASRSTNKFPNKYDYSFGLNFYINLSLRF
jgi:hypothetical protein